MKTKSKFFLFIIFMATLFIGIGYASINSVSLDIKGTSNARSQDDIYITEVSTISGSNTLSNVSNEGTLLTSRITLENDKESTVSINVRLYNSTDNDYVFNDIVYTEEKYDNPDITFTFDKQGETISAKNSLDVTITFKYVTYDSDTLNILNSMLNFKFKVPSYVVANYSYTGNYEEFIVPNDGTYKIELWGAQGGGSYGGLGGYTSGNIYLDKDDKLFVYVGGYNDRSVFDTVFNGGGDAVAESSVSGHENRYTPGGGATDVRLTSGPWNNFESLKSRIMVAGAGGGGYFGGGAQSALYGAAGGGLTGYNGVISITTDTFTLTESTGGTQTAGGNGGESSYIPSTSYDGNGFNGGFGYGGGGQDMYKSGGGSGYYGGGSSGVTRPRAGSGAGGSSFISGHSGCNAVSNESSSSSIIHTGNSQHYSGYVFSNTIMIDGAGYNWTTNIGSKINMPTHDGLSTMTGNTGNGHAKITYLGDDYN